MADLSVTMSVLRTNPMRDRIGSTDRDGTGGEGRGGNYFSLFFSVLVRYHRPLDFHSTFDLKIIHNGISAKTMWVLLKIGNKHIKAKTS